MIKTNFEKSTEMTPVAALDHEAIGGADVTAGETEQHEGDMPQPISTDKGYIKLHRRFFSSRMWKEARAFSECEAWIDLMQAARFDAAVTHKRIGGRRISFGRGELVGSLRYLSARWGWPEKKVRAYLDYLRRQHMIRTEVRQGISIIAMLNYEKYNPQPQKKPEPDYVKYGEFLLWLSRQVDEVVDRVDELTDRVEEAVSLLTDAVNGLGVQRGAETGAATRADSGETPGRAKGAKKKKEKKENKEYIDDKVDRDYKVTETGCKKPDAVVAEQVERLYKLYPSRCKVNNQRSTGKSQRDKQKLSKLLRLMPFEKLESIISWYVEDCRQHGTYLKNFPTFLNHLPEVPEDSVSATGQSGFGDVASSASAGSEMPRWVITTTGTRRQGTDEQLRADCLRYGSQNIEMISICS